MISAYSDHKRKGRYRIPAFSFIFKFNEPAKKEESPEGAPYMAKPEKLRVFLNLLCCDLVSQRTDCFFIPQRANDQTVSINKNSLNTH